MKLLFGKNKDQDDTVVAMLAAAIRRDISFGALSPDQKLKIEELRQRYGGSNHSMRETLRLLTAEGMVEATAQRGFRVTSATEDDLRDILMMRLHVERFGLMRSMERADVAWEGSVVAAHHALRRAEERVQGDPDDMTALEWDEACRTFSATLVAASGSRRLIEMQDKFYNQSRRFRLALLREGRIDFAGRTQSLDALRDAILAKKTERAIALLEDMTRAEIMPETG